MSQRIQPVIYVCDVCGKEFPKRERGWVSVSIQSDETRGFYRDVCAACAGPIVQIVWQNKADVALQLLEAKK